MRNSKFDETTFWYDEGWGIQEGSYGDFVREYADETTTPNGVAPSFHVRGKQLWTWGVNGNSPKIWRQFSSEEEAEFALLETFEEDMNNEINRIVCYGDSEQEVLDELAEREIELDDSMSN